MNERMRDGWKNELRNIDTQMNGELERQKQKNKGMVKKTKRIIIKNKKLKE